MRKKVLYLTYDGLSDPLGSSQIVPYLIRLQSLGFDFTIISFEKESRFKHQESQIRQQLNDAKIQWFPRKFGNKIPLVSKLNDLLEFKSVALRIARSQPFDMTLCRSYISAEVGLFLKQKIDLAYVFDTRGFWVDERIDKGIWNPKNPIYKLLIRRYRHLETRLYKEANHIIILTNKAKKIASERWNIDPANSTVIPCATNSDTFTLATREKRRKAKEKLNIPEQSLTIGYLGSLGGWYDLEGMMRFFKRTHHLHPNTHFVFLTPEPPSFVQAAADVHGINSDYFHIRYVNRASLDEALDVFDMSIFFISSCFSATACSPTRLAELWAKGIPVIANDSTGDLRQLFIKDITGDLISSPLPDKFDFDEDFIENYRMLDPLSIRNYAHSVFSIEKAVGKYHNVLRNV